MKRQIKIAGLSLLLVASASIRVEAQKEMQGHISLSGAFALYPLAVKWAHEFRKVHPKVRIDVSAGGAGKGVTDALSGMVEIGMVSREINPEELKKGAYPIAVAKDAVVAVMSASNPAAQEILAKGLKRDAAIGIWITGSYHTWADACKIGKRIPLHAYTRSDACGAAEVWAAYLGKKQEDLLGSGVFGDPGLTLAVKKDPVAIGFNNLAYAYDINTKKPIKGILVVPLDLNGNGKVDADENFYSSMDQLAAAIGKGKYPSPPARELYFVTKGKANNKLVGEFIRWVLTDGQRYVAETGYIGLPKSKIQQQLRAL